jgi:hypothetical protein
MDAKERLAAYRTRHVIRIDRDPVDRIVRCRTDRIRVVPRLRGWRHDPDEVRRLARAAAG